jgi:AcrR family transcriptional regulator
MRTDKYNATLRAAERLFADKGYARVSMSDIAKAAGVSKGLIYHHFPSKEELLRQILEDVRVVSEERFRTIVRSNETIKAKLRTIIETWINMAYSHPHAVRIVIFDLLSIEDTKHPLLAIRQANQAMLSQLVRECIAKEEFRHIDERIGALFIGGILRETVSQIVIHQLTESADKLADDIVELVYRGIGR